MDTGSLDELDTHDPRGCLPLLRIIQTGGLITPERDFRHRRKAAYSCDAPEVQCPACCVPRDNVHVMWTCTLYAHHRQPALDILARHGLHYGNLPVPFAYSLLAPTGWKHGMSIEESQQVWAAILEVCLQHVRDYQEKCQPFTILPPAPRVALPTGQPVPALASNSVPLRRCGTKTSPTHLVQGPRPRAAQVLEVATRHDTLAVWFSNGHAISTDSVTGSLFCRRCGKTTARPKHLRLKITGKRCLFEDVPQDAWLTRPGRHLNVHRLDREQALLRERVVVPTGHSLLWNRKCQKPNGPPIDINVLGYLYCVKCDRHWFWHERHCNLLRTRCDQAERAEKRGPPPLGTGPYFSIDTSCTDDSAVVEPLPQHASHPSGSA
eukprot:2425289-Amphidinium_carterae.1